MQSLAYEMASLGQQGVNAGVVLRGSNGAARRHGRFNRGGAAMYTQRIMRGWLFWLGMLILGAVFWGSPLFVAMLARYHASQAAYGTEWTNEGFENFLEMYAAGIVASILVMGISTLFSWSTRALAVLLAGCATFISGALFVAALVGHSSELKTYLLYLTLAAYPAGLGYGLYFMLRAPHMSVKAEKPYWISFYGGESISTIRKKARNLLYQIDCRNPDELLSECYVVSEGRRRFVPDDDYCTKPNDMIFYPRLAAAVSRLASHRGGLAD